MIGELGGRAVAEVQARGEPVGRDLGPFGEEQPHGRPD